MYIIIIIIIIKSLCTGKHLTEASKKIIDTAPGETREADVDKHHPQNAGLFPHHLGPVIHPILFSSFPCLLNDQQRSSFQHSSIFRSAHKQQHKHILFVSLARHCSSKDLTFLFVCLFFFFFFYEGSSVSWLLVWFAIHLFVW